MIWRDGWVTQEPTRSTFQAGRRVIVKVGTSTVTHRNGHLHLGRLEGLVRQLADLHAEGYDVTLVTSGAVGAGLGRLGLDRRPGDVNARQALAAIGQGLLMHRYESLFAEAGITAAQVLLTREDLEDPARRASAVATFERLFAWRVIPVVNENDTVTGEEIRVGDNDTLSARVAVMIRADLLILLSDVDGLYPADPRTHPGLTPLATVSPADDINAAVGGPGSTRGTGGMVTKIQAARLCGGEGIPMVLASGERPGVIREIIAGNPVGTLFRPGPKGRVQG